MKNTLESMFDDLYKKMDIKKLEKEIKKNLGKGAGKAVYNPMGYGNGCVRTK